MVKFEFSSENYNLGKLVSAVINITTSQFLEYSDEIPGDITECDVIDRIMAPKSVYVLIFRIPRTYECVTLHSK